MSENTGTPQNQVETTSVFRADLLKEMESGGAGSADSAAGAENLPEGAALLVVKRGPNAGARFLLDQDSTTAGRHPEADIFLDDVTVSRRHAEFRRKDDSFEVVDVGSLNGTYVNREPRNSELLSDGMRSRSGSSASFSLLAASSLRAAAGGKGCPLIGCDILVFPNLQPRGKIKQIP